MFSFEFALNILGYRSQEMAIWFEQVDRNLQALQEKEKEKWRVMEWWKLSEVLDAGVVVAVYLCVFLAAGLAEVFLLRISVFLLEFVVSAA